MILIQISELQPSYLEDISPRECLHIKGGIFPSIPEGVTAIRGVLLITADVLERDIKLGDFGTLLLENSNPVFRPPASIPPFTPPNTIPLPPGLPTF